MFCKNCGKEMDPNAVVCVNCGVAKGVGNNFCQNCGAGTVPGAVVCTQCGAALNASAARTSGVAGQSKSKLAAGLLGIFLGSLGIHNFYLGFTKKAVIQLVVSLAGGAITCGIATVAMEIWGLVEGIFYLIGKDGYTADAQGMPLSD